MIFDSHAHYDDKAFDQDRESLLCSLKEKGIGRVVNISSDLESIGRTEALTGQYPFLYGAAGVHPSDTGGADRRKFLPHRGSVPESQNGGGGRDRP